MNCLRNAAIAPLLVAATFVCCASLPARAQTASNGQKTLGQGSCQLCHTEQNRWWYDDRHSHAADPLSRHDPDYVRLAERYGTTSEKALLPDGPCARCHATAISDRGQSPILDGVSCESCHGPAERWLEAHKAGEKSSGRQRDGFVKALAAGLIDLEDLKVLTATCTRCHYMTDQKLVASGHTSGRLFDYGRGIGKIRHWKNRLDVTPEAIAAAFADRFRQLGEQPRESLVLSAPMGAAANTGLTFKRRYQDSGPVGKSHEAAHCPPLELPPFPAVGAGVSIEDQLRLLADRLKRLSRESKTTC